MKLAAGAGEPDGGAALAALLHITALAPKPTLPPASPAAFRCAGVLLLLLPVRLDESAASDRAALCPSGLAAMPLRRRLFRSHLYVRCQ